MSDIILQVEKLVKRYEPYKAVDGISFSVSKGQVLGFLGPNGAGKTTTIQILLGITSATSGNISYFGHDFFKHREESLKRINFASAFNTLLGRISVMENLLVYAALYEVKNAKKKIIEFADYFDASDLLNQQYLSLSAGQKTRVNIMKGLLNDPELLLMDEPTASLDPDIADKTLTLIEELKKKRNLSILYTSHNMEEITRICDEVIFLDHGKIVAHDTPLNLTKRIPGAELRLVFDEGRKKLEAYLTAEKEICTFFDDHTVMIQTKEHLIPKLIFSISRQDIYITNIEVKKPSLSDVFLQIARGDTDVT